MTEKGLGLIPTTPDPRDYIYSVKKASYPEKFMIDLKDFKVHDQGKYQNCATHALSALIEIVLGCEAISFPWYYGNRRHTDYKGQGTEIRGLLKGAQKDGGLFYKSYPFEAEVSEVIETFDKKYDSFKDEALKLKIKNYYNCQSIEAVKDSLLKGYPVLVGTLIFKSFYEVTKENNLMPMPRINGTSLEEMAGGHMMLIVGYDEKGFKVLNSWGESFGDNGIFTMPYEIVNWSKNNNFPISMFDAYAIDGINIENSGWYKQNGKWRYSENGKDVIGWKKVQGVWYYLDKDGFMKTGWLYYKNEWYFLNANGSMKTGWLKVRDRWYYFSENGNALKGFQTINGKSYYFSKEEFDFVKECQLLITNSDGEVIL